MKLDLVQLLCPLIVSQTMILKTIFIPGLEANRCIQVDLLNLPFDLSLRHQILYNDPNDQDIVKIVRRTYSQKWKGICQPSLQMFPQTILGGRAGYCNQLWFNDYTNWLEYSAKEDVVYCLPYLLFRSKSMSRNIAKRPLTGIL